MIDPTGHFINLLLGAIGAAVGGLVTLATDLIDDGEINTDWKVYAGAAAAGGLIGLSCGAAAPLVASGTVGLGYATAAVDVAGVGASGVDQLISTGKVDWGQAIYTGAFTAGTFGISTYVGSIGKPPINASGGPTPNQAAKSISNSSGGNAANDTPIPKTGGAYNEVP